MLQLRHEQSDKVRHPVQPRSLFFITPVRRIDRNGVDVLEPTHPQPQPQPQPPVYESRTSIDNDSISSGGSDSIPDEFYQVDIPSGSEDTFDEEDLAGDTPGYNGNTLNILRMDEFDDDQCLSHPSTQRERYEKHTGRFADAAPRLALSNIEMEYLETKEHRKDDRSVPQRTSTDDIPAATITPEAVRSGPTDEELARKIHELLAGVDLNTVTGNMIHQQLEDIYGIDLTPQRDFISTTLDAELNQLPAATISSQTAGSGPTDAELTTKVREILAGADLMTTTMKKIRQQLEGIYGVDLTSRRDFLSKVVEAELMQMDDILDTPPPQKPTSQPTDAELASMIHEILMVADFKTATKKTIRQQMEGIYGVDLTSRRDFINRTIDEKAPQIGLEVVDGVVATVVLVAASVTLVWSGLIFVTPRLLNGLQLFPEPALLICYAMIVTSKGVVVTSVFFVTIDAATIASCSSIAYSAASLVAGWKRNASRESSVGLMGTTLRLIAP
ncbi:hypothetical protein BGX34_001437 [Mortierella sp. NVP85]|nr:hypothetical protein BGX34_001437 [Mortierella sp. NVP85]